MKKTNLLLLLFGLAFSAMVFGQATVNLFPLSDDYNTGSTNGTEFTQTSMIRTQSAGVEAGWAKFDLSNIPEGATIESVELNIYVSDDNYAYCKTMSIEDDPMLGTAESVYTDCTDGTEYAVWTGNFPNPGWYVTDLGAQAVTDLTDNLTEGWFAVGMWEYETGGTYYFEFDGWDETNPPYIKVVYLVAGAPLAAYDPIPAHGAIPVNVDADLEWTFGDNTESYDLYFGMDFPPMTKVVDNETSGVTGTYDPGTMEFNTEYFWQIVAKNSTADLETSGPVWSFTTSCDAFAVPFSEGFEDVSPPALPNCWTGYLESTNQYAYIQTYNYGGVDDSYHLRMENSGDMDATILFISPEIEGGLAGKYVNFYMKGYAPNVLVGTMSDPSDPSTFVTFSTLAVEDLYNWVEYEAFFTNYTGTDTYFAFKPDITGSYQTMYFDEILVDIAPTCPKPGELYTMDPTTSSCMLGWTENGSATMWNIEHGEFGFVPTGTPTAYADANPFELTGLDAGTKYEFYVQSDCGGGDESYWVGPFSFVTNCLPGAVPIMEDFEAVVTPELPPCWSSFVNSTSAYAQVITQTYSGNNEPNSVRLANSDDGSATVIMIAPELDETLTDKYLNFFAYGYAPELIIGTMTDPFDDATFTEVAVFTMTTAHQEFEVLFDVVTGDDKYIAFKGGFTASYQDIYIDDILIDYAPTCPKPSDLFVTMATTESAMLNWSENGVATMWNIEWDVAGFVPTGVGESVDANPYELTGLTENTMYDFYVQSDCGAGDLSYWVGPYTFQTSCAGTEVPIFEDFDLAVTPELPDCWRGILNTTNQYAVVQTTTWSGIDNTICARIANSNDLNAELILIPPMALDPTEALNDKFINFHVKGYAPEIEVGTMTDASDASTFTVYETITIESNSNFQEVAVIFDLYTGTDSYIALRPVFSGTYQDTYIDNILIDFAPTCPKPSDLFVTGVTTETAMLNWTENGIATSWNIESGDAGFTPTGVGEMVDANPYELTGLIENTMYDFYVQAYCGEGDESYWVGPFTFQTLCTGVEIPIFEDFELVTTPDLPDCWRKIVNSTSNYGVVQSVSWNGIDGSYSLQIDNSDDMDAEMLLITPKLLDPTEVLSDKALNFFVKGYASEIEVGTITDPSDASTFTVYSTVTIAGSNDYTEADIYFSDYAGTDEYIAFRGVFTGNYQTIYMDNITIDVAPPLNAPSNLWATASGSDVALGWDGPEELTGYNVYRNDEFVDYTTEMTYDDAGLAPGTYAYYVTAVYDEGESDGSNTVNVTVVAEGVNLAVVYPMSVDYYTGSTDGVDKTQTSMVNAIGDVEKGWVKYDVSGIASESIAIDSIRMWVYVNAANWPYWRITPLASDPETADAVTIWDEVLAGQDDGVAYSINNEGSDFGMGWHSYLLTPGASADLEAALPNGWFATGLGDTDAGTTYFVSVDGWNEMNMPYLEVYHSESTLEPPTNLTAEVLFYDVLLEWDAPAGTSPDLEEIAYDDGTSEGGWWISNPSTAADYMAVRMTMPEDGTLQEIGLFTYTTDGDFNDIIVCADDGTGLPDLAAAYENFGATVVPYATGDWLFLTMSNPTAMTSGEDFWVVANWPEGNLNGPFIGGDNTVAPLEDRNYWNNAGTWNLWTADNFMMRAYYSTGDESYTGGGIQVIPSTNARELTIPTSTLTNPVAMEMTESWKAPVVITGMDELIGYNVYRDAELIGIVTSEAYVDLGLEMGMYDYYVTALYDEGESEPTNTVSVEIIEIVSGDCENFDDLTVGGYVAGQLGGLWSTWGAAPGTAEDATVSDAQSISPSNSMYVDGTNDMVHFFDTENLTSGVYEYDINIYVPTGYTGYFNLQKDITTGLEWGFQVMFEDDGLQYIDGAAAAAVLWPFDYDTWINCVMVVDLDNDWMMYYVDGELVHEYQWTLGTFGTPGAQTLGSANFYANPGAAGTPPGAYFDDICFEDITPSPCENFDELTAGGYVAEQLGGLWTTWSGTPGSSEDAIVDDTYSNSAPNAFRVDPNVDLIYQFGANPIASGAWLYSNMVYVASGTTGYFNVQSDPTPGVAWVIEITFNDGGTGTFVVDGTTTDFSYTQDVWFEVAVNIDVDNGLGDVWFDGAVVHNFETANTIGGIDWFGAAATDAAYYDDVCFVEGYEILPDLCEDFDDLTAGGYVAEQLGDPWTTWAGTPGGADDAFVSDAQSYSAPNSFIVDPNVDLIFKFGDDPVTSGAWVYSHMMYVASGTTGYFNVQSEPTPGVAWVIEITYNDGGTGTFVVDGTTTDFSYTQDVWFNVAVNIDVDNGFGDVWFDGAVVHSFETANTIGGIDYFGAAATDAAYYDEVCFLPGYEILPPAPPTDLVATAADGNMEVTWMAPSGEKSAVITNGVINPAAASAVEKSAFIKNDPAPASDAQFDLLFNFAPAGTAEAGIETDGMYIYTSVWSGTGNFLKYDQDGTFMEEFTIAGADGCRDMAYNGTYFYGGAASTTIFEMDFDFQVMVSTFTGPAACRAVAYNEVDDAFYCNNWSDDIVMFDMSGANLGSFPVGPVGASYYGLAFDNYSGGMYLWGYAQAGANTNELVQIELPSGTETGLYFDVGSVIDPAGSGIAGGLAIDNMFVPDVYSFVGNMQGIALWGLELTASTSLQGYNVYYSFDGGTFDFLDFTTSTSYVHEDPGYGEHCYYVTAVYESGESDPSNTDCDVIVGIEDKLADNLHIFPNPSNNFVNIQSDNVIKSVVIYNFAGQIVANEKVSNNVYRVNVNQYNPGVYIFQIETETGITSQRIIVE